MHKQRRPSGSCYNKRRKKNPFQSMSAPNVFNSNLLSVWRITICMEQSISQSPHSLYPIKEEHGVQWGLNSPRGQRDLERKPWAAAWLASAPLRERLLNGSDQVTYMTAVSLERTLRCVYLCLNHTLDLIHPILLWNGNSKKKIKHTCSSFTSYIASPLRGRPVD